MDSWSFRSSWALTALVFLLLLLHSNAQHCDANDQKALDEFIAGFITDDYYLGTWKAGTNCCQWKGINCTSTGRVQGLIIYADVIFHGPAPLAQRNTSYKGVVGATLGDLSELRTLVLTLVLFNGPMPNTFNKLKKLEHLSMTVNNFTGSLSPSIGDATSLKFLEFAHLTLLWLPDNRLSGEIPSCIGSLGKLEVLDLSRNSLSGSIPTGIGSLGNLVHLDLSKNTISDSIPTSLGRLTSLQRLDFQQNKLTGSIPPIGSLKHLQDLNLANNSLSGPIPASIGNLVELRSLDLSQNLLTQIPSEIGKLVIVVFISLSNNKLQGKLPSEIGQCGDLDGRINIDISYNRLSGSIPDVFGSRNISVFHASNNLFTGRFPLSLALARDVDLSHNLLSDLNPVGTLPAAPHLSSLNLANNHLSGPVPSWLTKIVATTSGLMLDVSVNKFTGPIPAVFLENLYNFRASHNRLSGQLPAISTSEINSLDLSYNRISGPITSQFFGSLLNTAFTVDLSFNQLSGPLPANSGDFFSKLSYLNLSYNKLSGRVPPSVEKMVGEFTFLDLSHNKFTGRVPSRRGGS
ncbi:hypothetical protein R1sor_007942 [Riccia sorocarpa]|uniref:Leucine-rich repeat-containing N-terminal plant-type domain-containing protein n=1 Tax=Riccia sorocarpa TaxID=122646 RepID=A0ABD3HTM6_9MARC